MTDIRQRWLREIGHPAEAGKMGERTLIARYDEAEFTAELYRQENGEGRYQRLLMAFPKQGKGPFPAVAVPFYKAEHMLGYDPGTGEVYPRYQKAPIMLDLLRRGYAVASADAYHISYYDSDRAPMDFTRWQEASVLLRKANPHWSGIGKLVSDTRLVIDALAEDERVDADRIGIAGFSLGGKMAFYTGCLDDRIRAIMAADFGFLWHQTNWQDNWYWASHVEVLKEKGMDHGQLLSACAPKPICILGGEFDTEESGEKLMLVPGYEPDDGRRMYLRYGTEHRPTKEGLEAGYDFLDKWLK